MSHEKERKRQGNKLKLDWTHFELGVAFMLLKNEHQVLICIYNYVVLGDLMLKGTVNYCFEIKPVFHSKSCHRDS
jgi:hypothetical protein